jgi:ribosome-binding protein aMBF1 (putative translation factor)
VLADDVEPHVGQVLGERRRALGVSQTWLAERLGIERSVLPKMERGTYRVTVGRFVAICHHLRIDPAEVVAEVHQRGVGPHER